MLTAWKKRFRRSRTPKYGTMDKGFTESEIGLFFRNVKNCLIVRFWNYQGMTFIQRPYIKECKKIPVFIDPGTWNFTLNYLAKYAVFHPITRLCPRT